MKTPKSLIVAAAVGILAAVAGGAEAYTCPTSTSCTPTVSYTEPSTYVSGAALGSTPGDGLKETEIQWALGTATPTKLLVPATAVSGGGAITNTGIAAPVAVCTVAVLNVSVIARTILGAVSAPATATPLTIDRTKLPTGAPDPSCTTPGPAKSVIVQ